MENEKSRQSRYPKSVRIWLYAGLFMIFFQVIIGGITRLTESGLSITKWEVVSGTLPPLNEEDWEKAFELYKQTPQYDKIFEGMSMSEFKSIYFWEYLHRLWARLIGFVFVIPFLYFLWNKYIDHKLLIRLAVLVLMGILVASFGWIMVASGLEERPWVDAYKLMIHLLLGCALFVYMAWIALDADYDLSERLMDRGYSGLYTVLNIFFLLLIVQIALGGMMSGMKAGLFYPTWPEMNGEWIPSVLLKGEEWNVENLKHYDKQIFMPALVQFVHRLVAYILFLVGIFIVVRWKNYVGRPLKKWILFLGIVLISQVIVGILTVIQCQGEVPVFWGVLHQGLALILLFATIACFYFMWNRVPVK